MAVACLVDVFREHRRQVVRIPANIIVMTQVVAGKGEHVEQTPDTQGQSQGLFPVDEQGQRDVLNIPCSDQRTHI